MAEALNPLGSLQKSAAEARGFTPGEGRDPGRWSVLTRSIGEVLTTDIRCDGLRMMLFSKPSDRTAQEVERRLVTLFEGEAVPSESAAEPQSAPALLHRAIVLLRGLVAEAERATERPAGAVALYYSRSEIACACLGGGEPDVWSHGRPFNAPWFALQPSGEEARRGSSSIRLFSLRIHADLDMRLRWPCLLEGSTPEGVIVDATWRVPPGLRVIVRSMSGATLYTPRDDDEASGVRGTTDARGEFFAGWFDDLAAGPGASRESASGPSDDAPAAVVDESAALRAGDITRRFSELVSELRERVEGNPSAAGIPSPGPWPGSAGGPASAAPDAEPNTVVDEPAAGVGAEPSDGWSADDEWEPESEAEPRQEETLEGAEPPSSLAATHEAVPDAATDPHPEEAAVAEPLAATPVPAAASVAVRRPAWPEFRPRPAASVRWGWTALWVAIPVVLFALGWWVGVKGDERPSVPGRAPAPIRMLRALGIGGARYTLRITSTPPGASLAVDGKRIAHRTPAELDLKPGRHRVTVSIPELGQVACDVTGKRGQQVPLEVPLLGTLTVQAPDVATPVAVTIDGEPRGFAPVRSKGVQPGTHELEFSTPGQPPWSQTVRVPVRGNVTIVARPFELPPTGVIQVRASVTDDDGVHVATGAKVWVDGERRGATPLSLELTRGPHSLRAEYRGEASLVQVIDLPGGNERYATFAFGTGVDAPRPVQQSPTGFVRPDVSSPVSVLVPGLRVGDVRESWLHVRAPNGAWRRYPMTLLPGAAGVVAVVVFPATLLDPHGNALYYVSVLGATGEEYFTEMRNAGPPPPVRPARAAAPRAGTPAPPVSAAPDGVASPPELSTEPSTP